MKKISIIIPCLNEERFIKKCIESVLQFEDIEKYDYELLIMDGRSKDNTRNIVEPYTIKNNRIKLIDNPGIIQSTALNIALKQAKGDWIMRLDAHADYPENYLRKLVETSLRTDAVNVGGILNTLPYDSSYSAQLVQALTTHKFGIGNSGFRVRMKEEEEVDTVPFGFFQKVKLEKYGIFNEKLVRCQDYELNCRIKKMGGNIWLNPEVVVNYYNQPNLFKFLKKQLLKEAPYNPYMWYLAPYTFTIRHSITGFFTFGIIIGILLSVFFKWALYAFIAIASFYLIIAIVSSIQQAIRYKKVLHLFTLPISFFLFHFTHGMGIMIGIIKLILGIAPVQKKSTKK